jgi:hypothetical protein
MICINILFFNYTIPMRIVLNMSHDLIELDSNIIDKWEIVSEKKFGDTYFLKTSSGNSFSCHENFWEEIK